MTETCQPLCLFEILSTIWRAKRAAETAKKRRIKDRAARIRALATNPAQTDLRFCLSAAASEIREEDAAVAGKTSFDTTPWDFAVEFIARRINFPEGKAEGELKKWVAHPLGTKAPPARRAVEEFKRLDRAGYAIALHRELHAKFPALAILPPMPTVPPVGNATGPSQTPKPKAEGGRNRGRRALDGTIFATYQALVQAYKAWKGENPREKKQVFINSRPDGKRLSAAQAYLRSPRGKTLAATQKMPAKETCQVTA